MDRYVCKGCGYTYDPRAGVKNRLTSSNLVESTILSYSGTVTPTDESGVVDFVNLPESWVCPSCGAAKDRFEPDN